MHNLGKGLSAIVRQKLNTSDRADLFIYSHENSLFIDTRILHGIYSTIQ